MAAAALRRTGTVPKPGPRPGPRASTQPRLADLATLGALDIETPLVTDLSADLHSLFDPVSQDTLPIYFGPLLGRLFLEGL